KPFLDFLPRRMGAGRSVFYFGGLAPWRPWSLDSSGPQLRPGFPLQQGQRHTPRDERRPFAGLSIAPRGAVRSPPVAAAFYRRMDPYSFSALRLACGDRRPPVFHARSAASGGRVSFDLGQTGASALDTVAAVGARSSPFLPSSRRG